MGSGQPQQNGMNNGMTNGMGRGMGGAVGGGIGGGMGAMAGPMGNGIGRPMGVPPGFNPQAFGQPQQNAQNQHIQRLILQRLRNQPRQPGWQSVLQVSVRMTNIVKLWVFATYPRSPH